jgi:AAA domain
MGRVARELAPHVVARVGTVDKFQGQEAAIVIYSMATSRPEDAPRGLEFLYSLNRLNVATSRARCAAILVMSPRLFEPECKTPRQMKLANGCAGFERWLDELKRSVTARSPLRSEATKQSRGSPPARSTTASTLATLYAVCLMEA